MVSIQDNLHYSRIYKYQQQAIGFKDLGIQLWEVHKYGDGTLTFNEVKPSTITKESIATITRNSVMVKRVSEEIRVYTEDDIIKICDDKRFIFRTEICNIGA